MQNSQPKNTEKLASYQLWAADEMKRFAQKTGDPQLKKKYEQMAAVNAPGIVGRVIEVGATYSKIRTMQNEDMRISVMVERTRDEGMLGGLIIENGQLIGLKLYYLPKDADLQVGDTIVTSGLGGIFPKGLYVGKVSFLADEDNGEYDACVISDVDFEHLEEVLVILGKES